MRQSNSRRAILIASTSVIAIVASAGWSQANAETITVSTAETASITTIVDDTGTIVVTSSGSVTTQFGGNHAIQPYKSPGLGAWTVTVDGSVKVLDADNEVYGVWLRAGGTVTVGSTGSIEGSRKGVVIENGLADVQNDGLIYGKTIAVHVLSGGQVENRATMQGGVVFATSATAGSFINTGTVSSNGGGFGVIMNGGGSINNSGDITFDNIGQGLWSRGNFSFTNSGTYTAHGDSSFSGSIYGVLMQDGDVVADNSGLIEGREVGMFVSQGTADVTNTGTIRATTLHAIALQTAGVTKFTQSSGLVEGGTHGLSVVTPGNTEISITGGTITGGLTSANGIGGSGATQMLVQNATINGVASAIQGGSGTFDLKLLNGATVNGDVKLGARNSNLEIATGAAVNGNIDGDIGANTLQLTGAGEGVFNGNITNVASLAVNAVGGTWTLGGNGAFTGGIDVVAGKLIANGLLNGAVTIDSGSALGGTGTLGATTIASGAIHAPGNSIGTQTIKGNYINHGTLQVEATPGAADQLKVDGAVDISNARLDLLLSPVSSASWSADNGPFIIIDNDDTDSVVGTFDPVSDINNLVFLDTSVDYAGGSGNDVAIILTRNDRDFTEVAATDNQKATADGLNSVGSGAAYNAVVTATDEDVVRESFDALSGELHASAQSALVGTNLMLGGAVDDRLRSAFDDTGATTAPVLAYGPGGPELAAPDTDLSVAWGHVYGSWGRVEGDGNTADLDTSSGGFVAGLDGQLWDWRLGLLAGYGQSAFDADDRSSSGNSDNYSLGLYGGTEWGNVAFRSGLAYSWHDLETSRSVVIPGFTDQLDASYGARSIQAFGELGYRFDIGNAAAIEPFANLTHVRLDTDGYTETGGAAALSSADASANTTFTTLGLRASNQFAMGTVLGTVRGMLGWQHGFSDIAPTSTMGFAGGDSFTITGTALARDTAIVEAGLDLNLSQTATIGFTYNGRFAKSVTDNGLSARLEVKF